MFNIWINDSEIITLNDLRRDTKYQYAISEFNINFLYDLKMFFNEPKRYVFCVINDFTERIRRDEEAPISDFLDPDQCNSLRKYRKFIVGFIHKPLGQQKYRFYSRVNNNDFNNYMKTRFSDKGYNLE